MDSQGSLPSRLLARVFAPRPTASAAGAQVAGKGEEDFDAEIDTVAAERDLVSNRIESLQSDLTAAKLEYAERRSTPEREQAHDGQPATCHDLDLDARLAIAEISRDMLSRRIQGLHIDLTAANLEYLDLQLQLMELIATKALRAQPSH